MLGVGAFPAVQKDHGYLHAITVKARDGRIIFRQHPGDLLRGKTHIHSKFSRNIPWTVDFMVRIRTKFMFYITDIVHSCQDYGLKSRNFSSFQIIRPQLCQKIYKHLIIGSQIHLIDNQHDLLLRHFTPALQNFKKCLKRRCPRLFFLK